MQSGPLMNNLTVMEQICDYAVDAGLNIIVYYSHNSGSGQSCDAFLANATAQYGSHFLGVYYDDEPGGKMIDGSINLYDNETGASIYKETDGSTLSRTVQVHASCIFGLQVKSTFQTHHLRMKK